MKFRKPFRLFFRLFLLAPLFLFFGLVEQVLLEGLMCTRATHVTFGAGHSLIDTYPRVAQLQSRNGKQVLWCVEKDNTRLRLAAHHSSRYTDTYTPSLFLFLSPYIHTARRSDAIQTPAYSSNRAQSTEQAQ